MFICMWHIVRDKLLFCYTIVFYMWKDEKGKEYLVKATTFSPVWIRLMDHVGVIFWQKNHWCSVVFIGLPRNNFEYIWSFISNSITKTSFYLPFWKKIKRLLYEAFKTQKKTFLDLFSYLTQSTFFCSRKPCTIMNVCFDNTLTVWLIRCYIFCFSRTYVISVFFFDAHVW